MTISSLWGFEAHSLDTKKLHLNQPWNGETGAPQNRLSGANPTTR
jgi:hypothetical protein